MDTTNFDELIKYNVSEAVIADLRKKYLNVFVTDFEDKANYEVAKAGHIEIKGLKARIEERRKELKADSLTFGRMVDSKAKEVTAPLLEIEEHLVAQRNIIDEEVKRRKEEVRLAEEKKVEERISTFAKLGKALSFVDAKNWTDETYNAELQVAKVNHENQERINRENEEARRKYEEEQAKKNLELEARERELRKKEQELAAAQAAENKRLREELEEKERAEEAARVEEARRLAEIEKKVKDDALYLEITTTFNTLEKAWDEILRLRRA